MKLIHHQVFQLYNPIKRNENKNNKEQDLVAASEQGSVPVFIFPVGENDPDQESDKKNDRESNLSFGKHALLF